MNICFEYQVIFIAQFCAIFFIVSAPNTLNSEAVKDDESMARDELVERLQFNTDQQPEPLQPEKDTKKMAYAPSSRRRRRVQRKPRGRCRIWSYADYIKRLNQLGLGRHFLKTRGIKIVKTSHKKLWKQPERVYGKKRCFTRYEHACIVMLFFLSFLVPSFSGLFII